MTFATRLEDSSQAAEARRYARKLAHDVGFDEAATEKVSIVVTEAGTNVLKHAGGGQLLMRAVDTQDRTEIEILALDSGPGMNNIDACLKDGYSTAGTSGTGLGAIARLSRFCDVYSSRGKGTALLARVAQSAKRNGHELLAGEHAVGVVQIPKPTEDVCGDQWAVKTSERYLTLLVADGLGHGPDAAKAARAAVEVFENDPDIPLPDLIGAVHLGLRPTRGAAVAAARLDYERRIVAFCGLGNISAKIATPDEGERHMVSINGTAGVEARTIREFTYPCPVGSVVILHSDGIATHWALQHYPGLAVRDPGLIAGVIYRDHTRRNDDSTIVVFK